MWVDCQDLGRQHLIGIPRQLRARMPDNLDLVHFQPGPEFRYLIPIKSRGYSLDQGQGERLTPLLVGQVCPIFRIGQV